MKLTFILIFTSLNAFSFEHSHKNWNDLLTQYTRLNSGQVETNYKLIKKEDQILNRYLSELEELSKMDFDLFSKDEKLAFWINAYNAYTVKLIIDGYPVKSIKDLGGLFSNPWSKEFISLFGKKMSLDNIEHDTIRKNFNEPRIHFAVNCASIGCPSLYREAFTAKNLDKQLDSATKYFLKNNSKNKIKNSTLYLSKIFKWYSQDFEKSHGSVKKFVELYLPEAKNTNDIDYLDYDWNLNEY